MAPTVPILLVEDDDVDTEALRRALAKAKVANQVHSVVDGVEALATLRGGEGREPIPQPCLMLLDINMPRMNGFELLKAMRRDQTMSRNVVFILSTSGREEDKQTAYDLNVAGYFLKDNLQCLIDVLKPYLGCNEFPSR